MIVTNDAQGIFRLGQNTVTWRAQDAKNRVATATQSVTVVDTTPPIYTFVPPDLTVNSCGPVALGLPTAADDCAGAPAFTNNAPRRFEVGRTMVRWTATDASGNRSVDSQIVTVIDTVHPAVACVATGDPNDDDHRRHRGEGDHDRDRDEDHDIDDGFFRVSSSDACTAAPPIRLGGFTLAPGEIIKMTQTHRSGVRRVEDVGRRHVRHFLVGRSANVITTVDGSGNAGSASCVVPHDHGRD